jgi:hypothetical protein
MEIAAMNLSARGTPTTITERLSNIPRMFNEARNDLRSTRKYLLSLNRLAHREVSTRARGPENTMKESKMVARRARDSMALLS